MKDQITRLHEELATERVSREILDERKTKELKLVESSVTLDLNVEKQGRKGSQGTVQKGIEDRCFQLRVEVTKLKKLRQTAEEKQGKVSGDEIRGMADRIETEQKACSDRMLKLQGRITAEASGIQELMTREKKVREDTENAMLKMLEDTCAKLQGEIKTERKDRETTQETLLKLLEETCARVESGFAPNHA